MKKNRIRLTESQLHKVIKESVKRVFNEGSHDIDDDNYYGGGFPDSYFSEDEPPIDYSDIESNENLPQFGIRIRKELVA